jgi:hypothetical protein
VLSLVLLLRIGPMMAGHLPLADNLPQQMPPVKNFTAFGGNWQVTNGELRASGGGGPKLISHVAGFSTGEAGVEMLLAAGQAGVAGLVLKVLQPGMGADSFIGYEVAFDAEKQSLRLGRHRHNFEPIRDVPCRVPLDQWFPVLVRTTETTLEVIVDGKSIIRYEDQEHPLKSGAIGFRPWQREARFRNFWVKTAEERKSIAFESDASSSLAALDQVVLPPIAFFTRHALSSPNTISCDIWQSRPRQPGCSIRILNPARPGEPAKTIFNDPDGCIYDMNLSPDARTLFFSYRQGEDPYWHIYRIGVDGQGLRQLTDGPYYDISPVQLPEGDLVFVSTRRGGYTLCQPGPASNLHRMNAGSKQRRLERFPWRHAGRPWTCGVLPIARTASLISPPWCSRCSTSIALAATAVRIRKAASR